LTQFFGYVKLRQGFLKELCGAHKIDENDFDVIFKNLSKSQILSNKIYCSLSCTFFLSRNRFRAIQVNRLKPSISFLLLCTYVPRYQGNQIDCLLCVVFNYHPCGIRSHDPQLRRRGRYHYTTPPGLLKITEVGQIFFVLILTKMAWYTFWQFMY
jgi:hypothetical protein